MRGKKKGLKEMEEVVYIGRARRSFKREWKGESPCHLIRRELDGGRGVSKENGK